MHDEAKKWLDAFFFDRYLHVQSKWIRAIDPWRPHAGLLTVLCVRSHFDVDDNSAASSMQACRKQYSNACAQCTEISIPKRDGHTYIHTYRRKTKCEAGLAASR